MYFANNGMGNGMGMGMGMGMNPPMNMMNMMQMYLFFQMMNQNNNNNPMPHPSQQNNNQQNSGMPRNGVINCDPFRHIKSFKVNIAFESSSGFKMNMPAPINLKLKDLFKTFVQKAGLSEGVLGKQINFICNASYLNPFDERTLQQIQKYGANTFMKFLVIDVSNLLGGNNN